MRKQIDHRPRPIFSEDLPYPCICYPYNLHIWSERLEKWGKTLFWILVIWGIIVAFNVSIVEGENKWGTPVTTFDFALFMAALVETGIYAFLEYCAYHVLALFISALALITQNTIISANVALYEVPKDLPVSVSTETDTAQLHDTGKVKPIKKSDNDICQMCLKYSSVLTQCEIKDEYGTRYRDLCDDCIKKLNEEME